MSISTLDQGMRYLERKELAAAAGIHARAFESDPYFTYTLRDARRRPEQMTFLMRVTLNYCFLYGVILATPGFEAVAAWLPPGTGRESTWRMIRAGALPALWRIGLSAIRRYLEVESICDRLHARYAPEPHWYLSQLGVEPALQGKGYGRKVLAPTLKMIDAQCQAVYLETLNPRAVPFYQNLGFKVCEQVGLPNDGPALWAMRRAPTRSPE